MPLLRAEISPSPAVPCPMRPWRQRGLQSDNPVDGRSAKRSPAPAPRHVGEGAAQLVEKDLDSATGSALLEGRVDLGQLLLGPLAGKGGGRVDATEEAGSEFSLSAGGAGEELRPFHRPVELGAPETHLPVEGRRESQVLGRAVAVGMPSAQVASPAHDQVGLGVGKLHPRGDGVLQETHQRDAADEGGPVAEGLLPHAPPGHFLAHTGEPVGRIAGFPGKLRFSGEALVELAGEFGDFGVDGFQLSGGVVDPRLAGRVVLDPDQFPPAGDEAVELVLRCGQRLVVGVEILADVLGEGRRLPKLADAQQPSLPFSALGQALELVDLVRNRLEALRALGQGRLVKAERDIVPVLPQALDGVAQGAHFAFGETHLAGIDIQVKPEAHGCSPLIRYAE